MAGDDPNRPKFVQSSTQVTAVVPPARRTPATGIPVATPLAPAYNAPPIDEAALAALPPPLENHAAEFEVTVGRNLTESQPDLGDLLKQCSGLTFSRGQLVAVHQRADFVEMIDPATMAHRRVELPRGGALAAAGLRAGAALELEAVVATRDWRGDFLMAFGAGTRVDVQRVVRMRVGAGELDLSVVEAQRLYRALWELPGLATSALNIEGAAWLKPQGSPAAKLVSLPVAGSFRIISEEWSAWTMVILTPGKGSIVPPLLMRGTRLAGIIPSVARVWL